MYESPIQIFQQQIQTQLEGEVLKAVQNIGVMVDKEELIRALKYDRDQYDKGFRDGVASTTQKHGYWRKFTHSALIAFKNGEPVWADRAVYRCSECDFGTIAKHNHCPRCGARMDGDPE